MKKSSKLQLVGVILGVILLILLVGPFLVPVPPLAGLQPAMELADPDSRFLEVNNLAVHYKIMGEGKPVFILLHGFGASVYSWQAIMEPLSQMGTIIAYDRPAFGLTERPLEWEGESPYSSQAQVDLLNELMNQIGIQTAILVGNSAGGSVAMQFYLQYPEKVTALILVDPAVYTEHWSGGSVKWLLRTPQMRHLGPLLARQIQVRGPELLELAWFDPEKITDTTKELYEKPLQVENWDFALWELTIAMSDSHLDRYLDQFILPVLVVTGEKDLIVPTEQSIQLANELPNASLVIIPEAGHVPHEEQPEMFIQAVTEFLSALR